MKDNRRYVVSTRHRAGCDPIHSEASLPWERAKALRDAYVLTLLSQGGKVRPVGINDLFIRPNPYPWGEKRMAEIISIRAVL